MVGALQNYEGTGECASITGPMHGAAATASLHRYKYAAAAALMEDGQTDT
jgi:hypothetical protein